MQTSLVRPMHPRLRQAWTISQISVSLECVYTSCRKVLPRLGSSTDPWSARLDTPPAPAPSAPAKPASPKGISAYPSLNSPGIGNTEFRITGVAGTGQDEDRDKFESAFPDLSDEITYDAVSLFIPSFPIGSSLISLGSSLRNPFSTLFLHNHTVLRPTRLQWLPNLGQCNPSSQRLNSTISYPLPMKIPSRSGLGVPIRLRILRSGMARIRPDGTR